MADTDIVAEITKYADEHDGRQHLSCHRAHVIREELGVSLSRIGQICRELNVKITSCQLGCFGKTHE